MTKEEQRAYRRAYYAKNRGKILANAKAWRLRTLDRRHECEAAWRKAHPEAEAAKMRRYRQRPEIKARLAEKARAKYEANPEKARAEYRAYYAKNVEQRRTQARISHAKSRIAQGKPYSPRYTCRHPEWAPVGGSLDVRSPWLVENMTPEQAAYARDLAIERKNQRERA